MLDDPHTQRLWDQAKGMTGDVNGDAVRAAGFRSVLDLDRCSDSVRATIAAACVQAAAHIFAALVQADLASQIREARHDLEQGRDQSPEGDRPSAPSELG